MAWQAPLSALLAVFLAGIVFWRGRRLRGTTLFAPALWAAGSLLVLAIAEAVADWWSNPAASLSPPGLTHLRFIAASTTLCPIVALLGAKRPQDRAWQFVVLSLWGVLAFFAATEWVFRPYQPLTLHFAVRWLLIAPLIGMGLVNYAFTRRWLAAVIAATGQVLLFANQFTELPWLGLWTTSQTALIGIVCIALAVIAMPGSAGFRPFGERQRPQGRTTERSSSTGSSLLKGHTIRGTRAADPLDRIWLDFRDGFGTFWGLRMAMRFNQTAEQLGWNIWLGWYGFRSDDSVDFAKHEPAIRQTLRSLLQRFVDDAWLEGPCSQPRSGVSS